MGSTTFLAARRELGLMFRLFAINCTIGLVELRDLSIIKSRIIYSKINTRELSILELGQQKCRSRYFWCYLMKKCLKVRQKLGTRKN